MTATSYNMYNDMSSAEFDQGCMYDWMADSRASSHITHQHDALAKYQRFDYMCAVYMLCT